MAHCATCDTSWTGMRIEHCLAAGCHKTFSGETAGNMHRTGKHHVFTGPDRRRCLTTEEMEARGMARNSKGHWMTRARESEWYFAWDTPTLDRAAEHGCLDENVETGDPVVCGACCTLPTDAPIPASLQRPRNAEQDEGGASTPGEGDSGCMKYGSEVE